MNFTDIDVASRRKKPKKAIFFEKMETVTPIGRWVELIRPHYHVKGNGREPIDLEIMVRMYLLSQWENYSDDKCEDVLCYDPLARAFCKITADPPDASTLGKFRNLLEKHDLCKKIFEEEVKILKKNQIMLQQGTGVDATVIAAPESRKNKSGKSNPEFSTSLKNRRSCFGIKAHIGVDMKSGLVHSVATTAAGESDLANAHKCLHGSETSVRADSGYIGIEKRLEVCQMFDAGTGEMEVTWSKKGRNGKLAKVLVPKKKDGIKFIVNKKQSQIKERKQKYVEQQKARKRWKVENAFLILKHIFGFRKTRLGTIHKNENKCYMMFTLVNCYMCSQRGLSTKTA